MKLFKLLIPKDNAQEVTELESFTLKWEIQGNSFGNYIVFHKCFISNDEAKEYENQLKSAAKLLGTWVRTEIYRN